MPSSRRGRAVALALVTGVALLSVQVALAESPVVRFNAADQTAAKAVVLKAADLGPGWKGGLKKPDMKDDTVCPGYNPKQSDLVVTGAAESEFTAPGIMVSSLVHVMQTPRMLQVDWQRNVADPRVVGCFKKVLPADEVVSVKRMPFAKLTPFATRFRLLLDYKGADGTTRVLMDMVAVGRGRTEMMLIVALPYSQRAGIDAAEVRLARIMLGRARA